MREMSNLSLMEWNRLTQQALSPAEAVQYLTQEFPARGFAETLLRICPEPGLRARLTQVLAEGGIALESADRTVRNWLSGKSAPSDRETVYRVAFGLSLSVEDTNRLLCSVADYGIHARDPVEVVYLFALCTGQSYAQAQALQQECAGLLREEGASAASTKLLNRQVGQLRTNADFLAWYGEHAEDFSQLHNAAYGFFTDHVKNLIGDGDDFSLEYISNTCLRLRGTVPLDRSSAQLSGVQRVLKHYWPSATTLKQMKNRRIDVSRKTLLLLYILCEGVTDDDAYSPLDEDYIPLAERLETHVLKVDSMLETCGMGLLDPRGPFDWLVMYCMCQDGDEGMSERMEKVISGCFGTEADSTVI